MCHSVGTVINIKHSRSLYYPPDEPSTLPFSLGIIHFCLSNGIIPSYVAIFKLWYPILLKGYKNVDSQDSKQQKWIDKTFNWLEPIQFDSHNNELMYHNG